MVTALVSILCFYGRLNADAMVFNAYAVWHRKQWYRINSSENAKLLDAAPAGETSKFT